MKLADIAARILEHLKRFEADKKLNLPRTTHGNIPPYYCANCWTGGSRVLIRYVSFQGTSSLSKADAAKYLEWLDAGNVGTHYKAIERSNG